MEKSFFIVLVVLAIGAVDASTKMSFSDFCNDECNNNICAGHDNNTAVPNEASCTKFFICIDERPVASTCPPGQWFNPVTCVCDSEPNPECDPSKEFECPPDGVHFFPHDDYCEKFIMCFAGYPVLSRCADGLHFDRELKTCNYPELAECILEVCPPYNDWENITFIPSEKDCEKFYICYSGEPLEFWCAPGIHFNPITNQCDFPENVNCTIEAPEDPNNPLPHEIECECEDSIFFEPHPNSCAHFFICAQGKSIMLRCAPDLIFDPVNDWCDIPENVECSANDGGNSTTAGPTTESTDTTESTTDPTDTTPDPTDTTPDQTESTPDETEPTDPTTDLPDGSVTSSGSPFDNSIGENVVPVIVPLVDLWN